MKRNEKIRQGIPIGVEAKMPKDKKGKDSSDEDNSNNVPIGYKYEENFPAFAGSKPKNP